jgi:hypothetical protein
MEFSHLDAIGCDASVVQDSTVNASGYQARELIDFQLAIIGIDLADSIAF